MQDEQEKNGLEQYRIADAPASLYYIPNFITPEEEQHILESIPPNKWISLSHRRLQAIPSRLSNTNTLLASPLPNWLTHPITDRFKDMKIFSDSPHGGANHCLINEYLPGQGIMPHEDGAAYHPVVATVSLNGSLVLEITPKTPPAAEDHSSSSSPPPADPSSTSSEENPPTNNPQPPPPKPRWRILQEPRSLLLTTEPAYSSTLHGIPSVHADNDLTSSTVANWDQLSPGTKQKIVADGDRNERQTTRISLTFRDVRKVSRLGMKVFGKVRT
ncbi:hypothetical protein KC343_g14666 [Hortaea werneckii]|uniref:Fe2OG dioxygenase domain-containing protein n=1 Tax=Hortaea werneckii TaxID=91943 RepID=A0A3M7F3H0_HORWE|nr:hypothetical protein KC346_g14590 [Hortaea werneckii]KAI7602966.1 hypothetical protein KC343_g14666 [Hortaea werneckii]KAI7639470.1 hypothetical protein KC319_g14397 [Hortaea werneckii]KAI7687493.1 hypothetical protein KC322_g12426 [Hortaea werneckii]RMY83415.1 hypothetical protein D0864_07825 [Hortaea werneckii]